METPEIAALAHSTRKCVTLLEVSQNNSQNIWIGVTISFRARRMLQTKLFVSIKLGTKYKTKPFSPEILFSAVCQQINVISIYFPTIFLNDEHVDPPLNL
jgi:hypothetical protein